MIATTFPHHFENSFWRLTKVNSARALGQLHVIHKHWDDRFLWACTKSLYGLLPIAKLKEIAPVHIFKLTLFWCHSVSQLNWIQYYCIPFAIWKQVKSTSHSHMPFLRNFFCVRTRENGKKSHHLCRWPMKHYEYVWLFFVFRWKKYFFRSYWYD